MKKVVCLILSFFIMFTLSSCFETIYVYPNMVEYDEEDVIKIAKEKYSISEIIFKNRKINSKKLYDENNKLLIDEISPVKIFNGDNLEEAFESFAGKNGGHDIKGMYDNFICYYGLGKKDDGTYIFFYYNLNLDKKAKIEDTIGMSEYCYDVMPDELIYEIRIPNNLKILANTINKIKFGSALLSYDKDKLYYRSTIGTFLDYNTFDFRIDFYKEDGIIVYDLYILDESEILIYSSSKKYGYIGYSYGMDLNEYFNMECEIEELDDEIIFNCKSEFKKIDNNILYSYFNYCLNIEEKRNDNPNTTYEKRFTEFSYDLKFEKEYKCEKYEGNNYKEISDFTLWDFYVFYEK